MSWIPGHTTHAFTFRAQVQTLETGFKIETAEEKAPRGFGEHGVVAAMATVLLVVTAAVVALDVMAQWRRASAPHPPAFGKDIATDGASAFPSLG
eukprot:365940-Chlamydomonas_euryale.AAC.33